MTQQRTVSVIIPTYTAERWDYLCEAVAAVQQQTYAPIETVVVVDHNPALAERARAQFPDAVVVENGRPKGINGARNSGLAVATGEILVFFDDDTIAEPDWVAQLIEEYREDDVLGVGGAISPRWAAGRPGWFPEEFGWIVGCTYRGVPEQRTLVRNLIGCNMSFRREIFQAVGEFREDIGHVGGLPLGCDETEFCIRLHQRYPGAQLVFKPTARVYHQVPESRTTWGYFRSRSFLLGQSKAYLSSLVGAKDGLSTERGYVARTLPAGVLRGIGDALRGDRTGLSRAAAITIGLACTVVGYAKGLISSRGARSASLRAGDSIASQGRI